MPSISSGFLTVWPKLYGNDKTDMQRWLRTHNNEFDYVDCERKLEEIVSYIETSLNR